MSKENAIIGEVVARVTVDATRVTVGGRVTGGNRSSLGRDAFGYLSADEALDLAADLIAAAERLERPRPASPTAVVEARRAGPLGTRLLDGWRVRSSEELRPWVDAALERWDRRHGYAEIEGRGGRDE